MAKGFFRSLLKPAAGGTSSQQDQAKTTPASPQQAREAAPDREATRGASPPPVDPSPGAADSVGEAAPPQPRLYPMTPERRAIFDEVMRQRARLLETMPDATRQKLVAAVQRLFSAQDRR